MDELMKIIQDEAPWYMKFADDVDLVDDNLNVIEGIFKR